METRKPKFFYGYVIVAAAFLIMMIGQGTILYTFGVFFKPLSAEFGWTRAMTSGAFSLRSLLFGFLSIVAGRVNDKFGPRIIAAVGGFFLGLGFLLMSQINAIWQLYLFFGVIGAIGGSGLSVPIISTVAKWFIKRRGTMTGIVVSGVGFGNMAIPLLAGYLIATYGWRTSYIIIGTMALLIILVAQFLRRDPSQMGQLPYGESETKQESLSSQTTGFSLREAVRTKQFWILGAMFSCFGFGFATIMVHIVPHVTDLGISAISAVNLVAIIGGLNIAGKIIMGSVADRIGIKPALIICFILISTALFWLLIAKEMRMLYLFAIIFGFAYGGLITLQSPIVAELFGMSSHGVILGSVRFYSTTGAFISPVLAGHIFDVTGSYNLAFLICATLSAIALMLTMLLRRPTSKALAENR